MDWPRESVFKGFTLLRSGGRCVPDSGKRIVRCLFLCLLAVAGANARPLVSETAHTDGRGTPKLLFPLPAGGRSAGARPEADAFVAAHRDAFRLSSAPDDLAFAGVRESLLGSHFRYRQMLNGVPVEGADLVVSVRRGGGVYQAYNNTYPVAARPAVPKGLIGREGALDAAWRHVRVHGRLLEAQRSELVYVPVRGGFRLVYKTLVAVEAPFGYWEHQIDAGSGEVVAFRDTVVYAKDKPRERPDFSAYAGEVWPRTKTAETYDASVQSRAQAAALAAKTRVTGTAQVFDGDPRTYLANAALVDSSPALSFLGAYVTRPLRDISLDAGTYSLDGLWVTIQNLEFPNTAPSTTATGNWSAQRGNNAFNDVMTYFHIDQNQRYVQSLGYTGAAGIQYGPIQADSDGLNGADNSYYVPSGNWLSFGHGGVDDNEDADVILHEYGHALTYGILPSWGGGDTGAIGEGFGDYWGASYSSTTTNGTTFHPEWAFSWDGHSADTWSGRFLNMTNLTYDASHTYVDHETINGIPNYSDQLWGTPLFQAFLALRAMGRPREEMDAIVLESFFGVGGGPTMRDMANATVRAAMELFPAGPHAAVFYDKFASQLILTVYPLPDPALVYPAGGESLVTGAVALVQWSRSGAPTQAVAKIEYSSKVSGGPAYFIDTVEGGANGWVALKSGGTDWAIVTTNGHSPTSSWFAQNDTKASEQFLTHASLVVSNGAVLAFWHAYDLEGGYDGAVVEISTNGLTWSDIGTNAVQNGYNATVATGYNNPLAGRKAFSGSSGGFVETRIPLSRFAGRTVSIRFRQGDDRMTKATGWWVDDISLVVEPPWTAVATTPANASSYAWTLPGAVGTNFGVRVKLTGSNMADSGWSSSGAFTLKGIPSVTAWPSASAITYGQSLSASALSGGAAAVAGAFAFVAPQSVPEAGVTNAAVEFAPADPASYIAVTGGVSVTVAPVPQIGSISVRADGAVGAVTFAAVGGIQYRVRTSDDLLVPFALWTWLTPPADGWVTAPTNGTMTFEDLGATNSPARFYRLEERAP